MLTAPGLTLLFLGVVVSLGTALVWMLWEIELTSKPQRRSMAGLRTFFMKVPGSNGQRCTIFRHHPSSIVHHPSPASRTGYA